MGNAFDAHVASISNYLNWLNANPGAQSELEAIPTFTWKGVNYFCNFKFTQENYLGPGGDQILDVLNLELLESTPDPGPQKRQFITFKGKEYTIQAVQTAKGKFPALTCWDLARGT